VVKLTKRLRDYYKKVSPESLSKLAAAVKKYRAFPDKTDKKLKKKYGLTLKQFENGDEPHFPVKTTKSSRWLKWFQKNILDIRPPEIESWPLFFVGCICFCFFFGIINFFEQEGIKLAALRRKKEERKEKRKAEKQEKAQKNGEVDDIKED